MALRLDKWLWYTRFFKTRGLAAKAVSGGQVHVNGRRVKPAHGVTDGDELVITRAQLVYRVTVTGEPARRGPAREAATFYREDPASRAERERQLEALRTDRMLAPRTRGKPDKHTRRKLRQWREGNSD